MPVLDGSDLEAHVGFTILLTTVTADNWPHLAMLSVGEVVAIDPREVRLALWPTSTAAANTGREGKVTLACVHNGVAYSIRAHASRIGETVGEAALVVFEAHIEEVFEDVAPYAVLEHGVRYRLTDETATLERWKYVIAHLKTALL